MNIRIELNEYEDAINRFNSEKLSQELDDYITNSCERSFFKTKKINLDIYGIKDSNERKKLENKIHEHYKLKLSFFNKIDKIDDYFHITLMIIGIIAIILSENLVSFLSELFLIAGWVVIWEIVYDLIFNEIKRRRTANIYKELSKCNISFKD